MPPSLACDSTSFLNALKAFPRGTSPGGSELRAQHLFDAVAGSVAPASQTCLDQLTKFTCLTLSGSMISLIAPWLNGGPSLPYARRMEVTGQLLNGKFYGVWQVV